MFNSNVRSFVALTTLIAGLLGVPGCDADEPVAGLASAHGMSLKIAESVAIELADGEVVELGLRDEQRAALECDGEARVSQVLIDSLELGDRSFAAPVLEASCDGEGPAARVSLREAGTACEGDECVTFGGADDLPLSAPQRETAAECVAGNIECFGCGLGRTRTRTTLQATFNPSTGGCTYVYSWGPCGLDMCPL